MIGIPALALAGALLAPTVSLDPPPLPPDIAAVVCTNTDLPAILNLELRLKVEVALRDAGLSFDQAHRRCPVHVTITETPSRDPDPDPVHHHHHSSGSSRTVVIPAPSAPNIDIAPPVGAPNTGDGSNPAPGTVTLG